MADRRMNGQFKRPQEFEQKVLDIARVTRVVAGGRRFSFRAAVAIGDKKGRVGFGVAKGVDVAQAVEKAVFQARKNIVKIELVKGTIAQEINIKYSGSKILLKPRRQGGLIAGGAVRALCELAGVINISAKIISRSSNKINNARAVLLGLEGLPGSIAQNAGSSI